MLPHIENSASGVNRWEPVNVDIFQVTLTLPAPLQTLFNQTDVDIMNQQIQKISGLKTLDAGPDTFTQKFMGTTRTFLNNKLNETSHELKLSIALNLRNETDNFIYKIFKEWNHLGYNIEDGTTALKNDYVADWLKVQIANRNQDVYREIIYKDVMLKGGLDGIDELSYETHDAVQLEITFVSDWAKEVNA